MGPGTRSSADYVQPRQFPEPNHRRATSSGTGLVGTSEAEILLGPHYGKRRSMCPLIELQDIHKAYDMTGVQILALRGLSLRVQPGEFVAIVGASGSGKSSLLHIIGCLDRPT